MSYINTEAVKYLNKRNELLRELVAMSEILSRARSRTPTDGTRSCKAAE